MTMLKFVTGRRYSMDRLYRYLKKYLW